MCGDWQRFFFKELSEDTSTSGLEKTSRLEWVAGLGIMCAAAAVVVIVLRIRTNVIDRQDTLSN